MNNDLTIEFDLDSPCPKCGKQLKTLRNKDGSPFMGTNYVVYCSDTVGCGFEEDGEEWENRLCQN